MSRTYTEQCELERLEQHKDVLLDMLDVVESFLPVSTGLVLSIILDPDKIHREVAELRRDHPAMTRKESNEKS